MIIEKELMEEQFVIFSFDGSLSSLDYDNTVFKILDNLKSRKFNKRNIKKVLSVSVELMNNALMHAARDFSMVPVDHFEFYIKKQGEIIYITSSNFIANYGISYLENHLKMVQSASNDQLKLLYNSILIKLKNELTRGAGLGIIDMALKSENKLTYNFVKINEYSSIFKCNVEIPLKD